MSGMEPALLAALVSTAGSIAVSQMNKPEAIDQTVSGDTGAIVESKAKDSFDEGTEDSKRKTLSKSRLGTKQLQVKLDTEGTGANVGSTAANSGLGIKV